MNPEAWFRAPAVCGSCVAWRPGEPSPDDPVAVGKCLLRPELGRVPASLGKCSRYQARGGFSYRETASPAPSSRRRRAAPAVIKRLNAAGELVDVTPAARKIPTPKPRRPREAAPPVAGVPSEPRPEPVYRPFPPSDAPAEVELGELSAPLVRGALAELIDAEIPGRPRDMHTKFRHGGRVVATDAAGAERGVAAHRFFARLERLARSIDQLEEALETHPKLDDTDELIGQVRRMRGSFTTFNVLFADRGDYFSGKA